MGKKVLLAVISILLILGGLYLWRKVQTAKEPDLALDQKGFDQSQKKKNKQAKKNRPDESASLSSTGPQKNRGPSTNKKNLDTSNENQNKIKFNNMDQLLGAYGASKDWIFHYSENGSMFKLTGEAIPGLINNPAKIQQFNDAFLQVQKITKPAYVEMSDRQDGVITHQDYEQKVRSPNGASYSVWEGWVRYLGNGNTGNVFQITNQLKSVNPKINLNLKLTVPEAIDIAHRYLNDAQIRCDTDGVPLVYTEGNPQELIFIVNAHAGVKSRRLFIGNDTRKVVLDFPAAIF